MTISHRAHVHTQLRDTAIPLSTALNALIVLAEELGDTATAAWARQEIDGYPAAGPVPDYRTVTAPIIGVTINRGAADSRQMRPADFPQGHRDEITRLDAGLGLRQGLPVLERRRTLYPASPDPVLQPGLPHLPELLRLMPEHAGGDSFVTFYWDIGPAHADEVLTAIRTAAEAKLRALPNPPPATGHSETRRQTKWAIVGVVATVLAIITTIAIALLGG